MTIFRIFLTFLVFSLFHSEILSSERPFQEEDLEASTQPQLRREASTLNSDDTSNYFDASNRAKRSKIDVPLLRQLKRKDKEVAPTRTSPRKKPTSTSVVPTPIVPKSKPVDMFYTRFCEVMKKGPHAIVPIEEITAQDEDREGSRKWVKSFDLDPPSHWHKDSSKVIRAMRSTNNTNQYLPADTNFAMARLTFTLTEGAPVEIDIPFFFVSGWPANSNKNPILNFSKKLSGGGLSKTLEPFKNYGLRFITMTYQGNEEKTIRGREYNPFRKELSDLMQKELLDPTRLISEARLKTHINMFSGEDNNILAKLYFHSEQSIWPCVKEEIDKFRANQKKKSIADIRNHLTKDQTDPIVSVFLDVCTFYDVCWCCGDTLTSCSHTLDLGAKVFVRASGCEAYYDQPLSKEAGPLRQQREQFSGFRDGKAYELLPTFKPYIAHAAEEDLL